MEEIRDVVDKVVRGCAKCGVVIDDVLAAFVARTVSYPFMSNSAVKL